MLTPHRIDPDRQDGAMVSLSHQQLTNVSNALWNFALMVDAVRKSSQPTAEPVQWFDDNAATIQTLYDNFSAALVSLDAVKKAGG